jgi:hypothetical protein
MQMPSSTASSFSSQQGRPASPTSITGLLPIGIPESQSAGWTPMFHSHDPNFNHYRGSGKEHLLEYHL